MNSLPHLDCVLSQPHEDFKVGMGMEINQEELSSILHLGSQRCGTRKKADEMKKTKKVKTQTFSLERTGSRDSAIISKCTAF